MLCPSTQWTQTGLETSPHSSSLWGKWALKHKCPSFEHVPYYRLVISVPDPLIGKAILFQESLFYQEIPSSACIHKSPRFLYIAFTKCPRSFQNIGSCTLSKPVLQYAHWGWRVEHGTLYTLYRLNTLQKCLNPPPLSKTVSCLCAGVKCTGIMFLIKNHSEQRGLLHRTLHSVT